MIPGWLKSFVTWLVGLFVHETVEQVKEEIQKPSTIENANTPKPLANKFAGNFRNWLRQKQSDSSQQQK